MSIFVVVILEENSSNYVSFFHIQNFVTIVTKFLKNCLEVKLEIGICTKLGVALGCHVRFFLFDAHLELLKMKSRLFSKHIKFCF